MSIYREWRLCKDWRRFFLDIEIQFAAGRNPKPDEYAADDTYPAHIECPEAHLGHITTPAGAQDFTVVPQEGGGGWGVVDVTRAAYVPNFPNPNTGD